MKLHRAVIYIDKEKIVQKEILYEIILVKMLLVCNQQILDLESGKFSDHRHFFTAGHDDDILDLIVIVDLEVHAALNLLGISLGLGKIDNIRTAYFRLSLGRRDKLPLEIDNSKLTASNVLYAINCVLQYKIGNHNTLLPHSSQGHQTI